MSPPHSHIPHHSYNEEDKPSSSTNEDESAIPQSKQGEESTSSTRDRETNVQQSDYSEETLQGIEDNFISTLVSQESLRRSSIQISQAILRWCVKYIQSIYDSYMVITDHSKPSWSIVQEAYIFLSILVVIQNLKATFDRFRLGWMGEPS